jgi:hypothetical protein
MNQFTDEHFNQLQMWAKFRGWDDVYRSWSNAKCRKLNTYWVEMWLRLTIADVPQIERLVGQPVKCWPVVVFEEPMLATEDGNFSFDELFGRDWIPTLMEIEETRQSIQDSWDDEQSNQRYNRQVKQIRVTPASYRDMLSREVWQRRRNNGDL